MREFKTEVTVDEDEIIDWIQVHLEPEDVFRFEQLKEWAIENGFIHESMLR